MTTETGNERSTLSREAVVDAALALADTGGIDAVSFRRLAAEFGVTPMALYRYVSNKDELLSAVMDRVWAEFELPADDGGDWQEQLRAFARTFRRLLLAHPAAAQLYFAGIETIHVNGLRIVEALLDVLERAGFGSEQAALLEGSLERAVLALVLVETRDASNVTAEEREQRIRLQRGRLMTLPPQHFPRVIAAADIICGGFDPDQLFEFSVDLLIAGLERLLERS